MIRVVLVDDHAVMREGLRYLLHQQRDFQVVGEGANGADAAELAGRLTPDVVLLDLLMPEGGGVRAIPEIRRRAPQARVVVLSASDRDGEVLGAIREGAHAYLLKDMEPAELVAAIRRAHAGEPVLSTRVTARLMGTVRGERPAPLPEALTPREREVLAHIARGHGNPRIARELHIGEETVKTHVAHVLGKLQVSDRTAAAVLAVEHGLLRADGP